MDNINLVISENLKRLREQRKMSLDAVAKLPGVSKSMLGQIERGEVNPTVFSGYLEATVNGTILSAENGGALRFKADLPHRYYNPSQQICRLSMVIYYPEL